MKVTARHVDAFTAALFRVSVSPFITNHRSIRPYELKLFGANWAQHRRIGNCIGKTTMLLLNSQRAACLRQVARTPTEKRQQLTVVRFQPHSAGRG